MSHDQRARIAARAEAVADNLGDAVRARLDEVKPKLRGWIHTATVPVTLAAGIVLVVLSPTAATRLGSSVYMGSALLLFTVSAVYHRGSWSPRGWAFWRRFDHANIFVLIAGSYTPFTILLLDGADQTILLSAVWGVALLGVCFRVFWTDAPRWLYIPVYIGMGWAAMFYINEFAAAATAVLVLIIAGGVLYTVGGIVYGLKRPDPFPRWFGFHEVFHTFTIVAFLTHYVGVSIATYSLR